MVSVACVLNYTRVCMCVCVCGVFVFRVTSSDAVDVGEVMCDPSCVFICPCEPSVLIELCLHHPL